MQVKILLFATLKDRAGTGHLLLDLPDGSDVTALKAALAERHPPLAELLPSALTSVNQEFALPDETVPDGAEVALFPPVSGGDWPTVFQITNDELDLNALTEAITLPTTGAVCMFTGIVRGKTTRDDDSNSPHDTAWLEYEAYAAMAEAKLRQVADEIRERWATVQGIAIVQRIGVLQPGTPTVLIACSAGHRDTGVFEAARYGIDRLKEIVPVWKKEVGPDGQHWVEGHYQPKASDRG